jgi:hypothetical protein
VDFLVRDFKPEKRPYSPPSFEVRDASAAKAELEALGALQDDNARQMLSVANQQLEGKTSPPQPTGPSPQPKSDGWGRPNRARSTKHEKISWNPATQEWFCAKCGRTSDHTSENDAYFEIEQFECQIPWVEMPKGISGSPGE